MPKTIAVIDGNSLMHRGYHAIPPTMNAPDGTPTNAVFGFLSMFLRFCESEHPDAVVCAFDCGKPSYRIALMPQYKANRPHMDDELRVQFPLIKRLLASLRIPVVEVEGREGDDILGTVSARAEKAGCDCLLLTGDKDACQLASDRTRIVNTKKGASEVVVYDPDGVYERYGVTPGQFTDFLGLMGDTVDNIPGVPGVGEKTAAKLLSRFGSIEGIYDNLDQLKGKQLQRLADNKEEAFLSRRVATIVRDLDFELDLDGLSFPDFRESEVEEAFGELGLYSQLKKVLALSGAKGEPASAIEWGGFESGEDALRSARCMMDEANPSHPVGVAIAEGSQQSLFGSCASLALSLGPQRVYLEGEQALEVFAELVERGVPFAVSDSKRAYGFIYPADSSEPARIRIGALDEAKVFDLSLAAYALDSSSSGYSVRDLGERYLAGALPEARGGTEALVMEAAIAEALVAPIERALEEDGAREVYRNIDLPLVSVLVGMERVGAALDDRHLASIGASAQEDLNDLADRIYELAGEEFNISSPKQVGRILFDVVGLKPLKKTSRGYSTDASVLRELSDAHPLPGLVLKHRELAKIKSTYIDALPGMRASDGRLHTSFNETVASTGRLSSSDPNLQNIPVRTDFGRSIRECFVPLEPGDVFLSADYSQIELRLLAHLSGDEGLIEAFSSGADFHRATAARVFGISIDSVTPELRSRAKAVNFGIVYGQQAYGLSQSLRIPIGEAGELIECYFETYPGVRTYLDEVVDRAKECGYAVTMFGRKRHIPELRDRNAQKRRFGERMAMNHPMQGSAADIIKLAMVEAHRRLSSEFPQAKLMLQVHDELDLSVPESQASDVAQLLREVMEQIVSLRVPLIVDVAWGSNWAEAH